MIQLQPNRFVTTSYILDNSEIFCEVKIDGKNSQASIYSPNGKLRARKHLDLPANCKVAVTQQFLLLYNESSVNLYNISKKYFTSVSSKSNPFGDVCNFIFDSTSGLHFISNSNKNLYYLMARESSLVIKEIFSCKMSRILGEISNIGCDNQNTIYAFFEEKYQLLKLTYDWMHKDKLVSITNNDRNEKILDFYSKNGWIVIVSLIEGQEDIKVKITNSEGGEWRIRLPKPQGIVQSQRIARVWNQNLFLYDENSKRAVLIWNKQIFEKDCSEGDIGPAQIYLLLQKPTQFMFTVGQAYSNNIFVRLRFQDGIKSNFIHHDIEFLKRELSQHQKLQLYLHNNIANIFDKDGCVVQHFVNSVSNYCQVDSDDIFGNDLAVTFMDRLFMDSPNTCLKLSRDRILRVIKQEEDSVQGSIELIKNVQNLLKLITNRISELRQQRWRDKMQEYNQSQNIIGMRDQLACIIRFHAILAGAIKQRQKTLPDYLQYSIQSPGEKAKCLYLLTDFLSRHKINGKELITPNRNIPSQLDILNSPFNKFEFTTFHQLLDRVPLQQQKHKQALHDRDNLSDQAEEAYWSCDKILDIWLKIENFHHAAYLCILVQNALDPVTSDVSIPFISDSDQKQMLLFMVQKSQSDASGITWSPKYIAKLYDKMHVFAGIAMKNNDYLILMYLCYASISLKQFKTCSIILASEIFMDFFDQEQMDRQIWQSERGALYFIIRCLVLCDEVFKAFHLIQDYPFTSLQAQDQYIEHFINLCHANRKITDLIQACKQMTPRHYEQTKKFISQAYSLPDINYILSIL